MIMKLKSVSAYTVIFAACLGVAACEPQNTSAASDENVAPDQAALESSLSGGTAPVASTNQIDWTAAKQARIEAIDAGLSMSDQVMAQAAGNGSNAVVPVMLPSGIVLPANETQTIGMTPDGYFASYPGIKYDIIVNGTNEVFATMNEAAPAGEVAMKFTEMEAGAQIAFSRFGADYLVEFECNIIDAATNCVDEDEALKVAEGLFVAFTQ
jgi:hypothetical protein